MIKEAKWDKTRIGVGTSVIVKAGETDEKIRERKTRRIRKELFGLYYLAPITSFLIVSDFWWLLTLFYMVYR